MLCVSFSEVGVDKARDPEFNVMLCVSFSEVGVDKAKDTSCVRPRSNSDTLPVKADLTLMEKLDQELQRVLDLSSSIVKGIHVLISVPRFVLIRCFSERYVGPW